METKIVKIGNREVIIGLEGDEIHAQFYTGTPPPPPPPKTPPEGVTDKISLSNWIIGKGIKRGSIEYDNLFNEYSSGLPLESNTNYTLK